MALLTESMAANGKDLLTALVSDQGKEVRRHHGVLEKDGR